MEHRLQLESKDNGIKYLKVYCLCIVSIFKTLFILAAISLLKWLAKWIAHRVSASEVQKKVSLTIWSD